MKKRVDLGEMRHGTELLKRGFAKMQEGGVVMDVVTAEEAHVAEDSGAVSVMALERVPADIRASGGVARMSHPQLIKEIMAGVFILNRLTMTICVMIYFITLNIIKLPNRFFWVIPWVVRPPCNFV